MIDLLGAFSALRVTAVNLFRKKVTEPLPWEGGRARPERYRTSFALVHNEDGDEACIGCKMCEKICPSFIISVQPGGKSKAPSGKMRGTAKAFTLDLNACIHCELCVQVCPEDAILMLRVPETPGFSREDVFLTMEKLYANEPVQKAWGTGALLVAMQEPAKPAPKPAAPPAPAVEPAPPPAAPPKQADVPTERVPEGRERGSESTNPTDVPTPTLPLPLEPEESTTIVPKPSGEGASS